MTEEIAAVRRNLDIKNRIAWKKVGNWRANFRFGRQNQKTGCILTETKLDRAAKHSLAFNPAQFAFSNLGPVRQLRAGHRERNFVTNFVIGRAANDLAFRPAAVIDFANCQAIGIWVARRRGDLRNDHVVDLRAACFDVFGLDAGAGKQFRDLLRIFWKVDKFPQPVDGKFHRVCW